MPRPARSGRSGPEQERPEQVRPERAAPERVVVRPRSAALLCLVTAVILAALMIDALLRAGADGLRWLPAVLLIGAVIWAVLWRPCVIAGRESVQVRNVLSTADLPYAAVTAVRIGAMVRLEYEDASGRERTVTAWNAPGVGRESPRGRLGRIHGQERSRTSAAERRTVADWGERLVRDQQRSPSAVIRRRWEQWHEQHPPEQHPQEAAAGRPQDSGRPHGQVRLAAAPLAIVLGLGALTAALALTA